MSEAAGRRQLEWSRKYGKLSGPLPSSFPRATTAYFDNGPISESLIRVHGNMVVVGKRWENMEKHAADILFAEGRSKLEGCFAC